ncbi:MAG: general secretion pathway protein GspE, partial [Proteobacteria bacterium]|nr:general secretion pathway protein GspE [Pseudomonadota bacterium]
GIYEVLHINSSVQEMIINGLSAQQITRECVKSGQLTTLKMDAAQKIIQGITTVEEAASAVMM